MAILAECPICHRKQATKNKVCNCGENLDKAKKSRRVKYWIQYRLPGGKQRKESLARYTDLDAYSIKDARELESKRAVQKRENRAFEMLPEANMTFSELAAWYLNLRSVKKLASHDRVKLALTNFNKIFGSQRVGSVKPVDLEEYQGRRETNGLAPATIDMEISIAKTMIIKAFDNDMVGGRTVKAFRKVKRKLKKAANARKRVLTIEEYLRLTSGTYKDKQGKIKDVSPPYLKAFLIFGFNTGMRLGELRQLKWPCIDAEKGFIRLPAEITKEGKPKNVPINHHYKAVLDKEIKTARFRENNLKPLGYVLTYNGKPIKDKGGLKRSFKTACKNVNIPCGRKVPDGITFHDIRRTVKTNMVNAGVDKVHRDVILGHSLQGMDAHYMAPSEEDLQKAMEKYTKWLDETIAEVEARAEAKAKEVG